MLKNLKLVAIIFLCSCMQKNNNVSNPIDFVSKSVDTIVKVSAQLDDNTTIDSEYNLDFKIDSSGEDDSKILNVFSNGNKILSHVLIKSSGDCSSINIELGKYKMNKSEIIFYSYWAATDRQNISIYPFGFRKQVYTIGETGNLIKQETQIYVEDNIDKDLGNKIFYAEHEWKHKGLEFLQKSPKNYFEKRAKENYIENIEKMYKGKFVFDIDKTNLENEVRAVLKTEIALHTGEWKEGEAYGYGTVKK